MVLVAFFKVLSAEVSSRERSTLGGLTVSCISFGSWSPMEMCS